MLNKDLMTISPGDRLMLAVENNTLTTVRELLESGVDPDYIDLNTTPLIRACTNNNIEIAKLLVSYGADVNLENNFASPLLYACYVGSPELILFLISSGADITARDLNNEKCIHAARSVEVLEILIAAGADPEALGYQGRRPIHSACYYMKPEVLRYLIQIAGVDVNARDEFGHTASYYFKISNERPSREVRDEMANILKEFKIS